MGSSKKHKKHKSERKSKYDERPDSLKLILKLGNTPEYSGNSNSPAYGIQHSSHHLPAVESETEYHHEKHKKSKKKKKKKDREKRHKHHKEKKHHKSNSSQQDEDESMEEESSSQMNENQTYYSPVQSSSNNISATPVTRPMIPFPEEPTYSQPDDEKVFQTLQNVPLTEHETLDCLSPDSANMGKSDDIKMESPRTPSSMDSGGMREPRTCVLKLKQSRTPIAKLLDHLMKALEKRDPHQFFAWPVSLLYCFVGFHNFNKFDLLKLLQVTDQIAPGYSNIISKPMDFSTMRQKIEDNEYQTIGEFCDDFKLMCENAIKYNHADTVYHKAAKRLLHVGLKLLQPENLVRTLRPLSVYLKELTPKELGFDLSQQSEGQGDLVDSADEAATISNAVEETLNNQLEEEEKRRQRKIENDPKTRFEPFVDNLTSEEILEQVKSAAKAARDKILSKKKATNMGFLRTHNDGTTSLQILVQNDYDAPERMPTLSAFVSKLQQGTGQLQGFREDRRNSAKTVKTLDYGAFSSHAPVFDSRFSNLSKEETDLILNTYGDENGSQYADSITKFSKDSSYASTLANRLLDLLTRGEHSKTMETLTENENQKQVQKQVEKALPDWEKESKKHQNVEIDFDKVRTLKDLGFDVKFIDEIEEFMKNVKKEESALLQEQLAVNASLMEKLQKAQYDRLSAPLPHHLSLVPQPDKKEVQLANQITTNFTEIAKKYFPPAAIASVHSVRKAMGIEPPQQQLQHETPMEIDSSNHHDIDNELRELLGTAPDPPQQAASGMEQILLN